MDHVEFTYFYGTPERAAGFGFWVFNALEIVDGILTGRVLGALCDAAGKAAHVREIAAEPGLHRKQIIVIGDGANDLKMMQEAGLSIAYRAKPVVQMEASIALNVVGLDGVLALFEKN